MKLRERIPRLPPLASSLPIWVLLAGLVATAAATYYVQRAGRARDQLRFERSVEHVRSTITGRVDTYVALLRAGTGLFAANPDVRREEFAQFVSRLDLRGRYPGIQGIGFAQRVAARSLDAFVEGVRTSGRPAFRVWPDFPREAYFPIVYLEPEDRRNTVAIGYDMFTEPVRRTAMEAAARTGTAAASGKVTLVQEIDAQKQPGFLIYAPVYERGGGDRQTLLGFVYGPLRAGDFLSSVLTDDEERTVSIAVFDGADEPRSERLLYDDTPVGHGEAEGARFRSKMSIDVAGRPWVVHVRSRPAFHGSGVAPLLPWIALVGLLVTLSLTFATWREASARAAAESAAQSLGRSEEALRASETRLLQLIGAEREAHAQAAAANRAKDEFLATVSHELRTPLNAILGWATMLRNGRLTDQARSRALDVIARSARTQADLIEDLLDVSRIITGKMAIEQRQMRLSAPIRAALDAVRPAAEAKGIIVDRRFESDPAVLGDPDRLQQVAWNLLSNAIKFTPAGGRVSVSLRQHGDQAELMVSDSGIGIDESFLPHVFERFQQHDSSTTRSHGGMGLGLAIVKNLVEAHGGTVSAESGGANLGSTFTMRLPVHGDAVAEAPQARPHDRPRRPADSEFDGLRVLVVDDDADARELLTEVLASHGAQAQSATTVEEALRLLDRGGIDLVLSDIGMPGTDGYALARRMRTHPSDGVRAVPAVAVTAYASERDREAAIAAGYQAHLPKPVDLDALRSIVRRLAAT